MLNNRISYIFLHICPHQKEIDKFLRYFKAMIMYTFTLVFVPNIDVCGSRRGRAVTAAVIRCRITIECYTSPLSMMLLLSNADGVAALYTVFAEPRCRQSLSHRRDETVRLIPGAVLVEWRHLQRRS